MKTVTWEIDDRGVVNLTLNRPTVHNAFNDELIMELTASFKKAASEDGIRVLVLSGKGKSFSAGADLNWMRNAAEYSPEENRTDADRLAAMLHTLDSFPVPTVVAVNGAAFGGLIHNVVPNSDLAEATNAVIQQILSGGPQSQIAAKALLSRLRDKNYEEEPAIWTAKLIAEIRATDEAKSGINAFLEKTTPPWLSNP